MSYLNPGVESICECDRWKGEKCGRRKTRDYLVDTWHGNKAELHSKEREQGNGMR